MSQSPYSSERGLRIINVLTFLLIVAVMLVIARVSSRERMKLIEEPWPRDTVSRSEYLDSLIVYTQLHLYAVERQCFRLAARAGVDPVETCARSR